jgi:hypothetical protein
MAANPNDVLNEKLVSIGFTADDVAQAREASAAQKISLLHALENLNKVASRLLVDTMGVALGCSVVHLEDRDIPQNIIDQIPKDLATKMRVVPIERSANNLIVATGNPVSPDLLKAIQLRTNFFTRAVLASEARIRQLFTDSECRLRWH